MAYAVVLILVPTVWPTSLTRAVGGFAGGALVLLTVFCADTSVGVAKAALGLLAVTLLLTGLAGKLALCDVVAEMELLCMIMLSEVENAIENLEKPVTGYACCLLW